MSESIRQLIASQPLGVPADVLIALAIIDSDVSGTVRSKSHDIIEEFLTTYMKPTQTGAKA